MRTIASVNLAERLEALLADLPDGWSAATFALTVPGVADADRAAGLLGPLAPGRVGRGSFRLTVSRVGTGPGAEATRRLLTRLDAEGIDARLSRVDVDAAAPTTEAPPALAGSWDGALARFPADWSDAELEVELLSGADVERAALLLAPVNPFLHDGAPPAFRFRSARRFGYGAAVPMVHRCLARLDEAGVVGRLHVRRVLSETEPVLTQGPVWREGGRAV